MVLARELETYREKLPELLQHEGKYVVIFGTSVVDIFATYEDALRHGYRRFGLEPFLVRQIHATEPVVFLPSVIHVERVG